MLKYRGGRREGACSHERRREYVLVSVDCGASDLSGRNKINIHEQLHFTFHRQVYMVGLGSGEMKRKGSENMR